MAKSSKEKTTPSTRQRLTAAANNAGKGKKQKGRVKEYFKGVKLEMNKVVWPTKKELGSFTAIVLITCAAFALVFWAVDTGVLAAIKAVCF